MEEQLEQIPSPKSGLAIAVVGSGISGITASYLLSQKHQVTLFEKNHYAGGHTHTVVIEKGPDTGIPIDTGFIVLNERTYPNFIRFLSLLQIGKERTDMSFSYYEPKSGFAFASKGFSGFFAQRINMLKPAHWRFLFGVLRFLRITLRAHQAGEIDDGSLGDFFASKKVSKEVRNRFVIPMAAAIWSAPDSKIVDFPMRTFAHFYANHGLLTATGHPPWYFVTGGSHSYVKAFVKIFGKDNLVLDKAVSGIQRKPDHILLRFGDGSVQRFDKVVIATHADEALALLDKPSKAEQRLLAPWSYSKNTTLLHTDPSLMPTQKRAWASWNYLRNANQNDSSPITVTYYMNRLQRLTSNKDYFVTLNPSHTIPDQHIVQEMSYTHPVYNFDAFATQKQLRSLNGQQNTFYCGAYFGYGFHEDGVNAALSVAAHFGISL